MLQRVNYERFSSVPTQAPDAFNIQPVMVLQHELAPPPVLSQMPSDVRMPPMSVPRDLHVQPIQPIMNLPPAPIALPPAPMAHNMQLPVRYAMPSGALPPMDHTVQFNPAGVPTFLRGPPRGKRYDLFVV